MTNSAPVAEAGKGTWRKAHMQVQMSRTTATNRTALLPLRAAAATGAIEEQLLLHTHPKNPDTGECALLVKTKPRHHGDRTSLSKDLSQICIPSKSPLHRANVQPLST